jgi:hypothetical protein
MKRICRVAGCENPRLGFSVLCNNHKKGKGRNGHPTQVPVSTVEVKLFGKTVTARIQKNIASSVWSQLDCMWLNLVQHAKDGLELNRTSGKAYNKFANEAYQEIVKVADHATPREVVEVALTLYLIADYLPRRFASDEAFLFQLVRRVRYLAPAAVGRFYDHTARVTRTVYREMRPRTTMAMATLLQRTFGASGVIVARLEQRDIEQAKATKDNLLTKLSTLA